MGILLKVCSVKSSLHPFIQYEAHDLHLTECVIAAARRVCSPIVILNAAVLDMDI